MENCENRRYYFYNRDTYQTKMIDMLIEVKNEVTYGNILEIGEMMISGIAKEILCRLTIELN